MWKIMTVERCHPVYRRSGQDEITRT